MGGSVIKNINIEGTIDSNDNISNYIGILAGINYGKIKNCNVGGSIKVNGNGRTDPIYIGGFVSQNVGEICYSNSTVSLNCSNLETLRIGGICGYNGIDYYYNYKGNIHDCTYILEGTGIIINDAYNAYGGACGGVCGENMANISDIVCNTNVKIESTKPNKYYTIGGIIGSNSSSKVIKNLFANVNIERTGVKQITSMYAGGIIGSSSPSNGKLYNSYAKGSVKCNVTTKNRKFSYIGGIVANASNMEIDNCYSLMNTDEAKDNSNKMKKGGIAGCVDNTIITYCYKK